MDKILKIILAFLWLVVIVLLATWLIQGLNNHDFRFFNIFNFGRHRNRDSITITDDVGTITVTDSDFGFVTNQYESEFPASSIKKIEAELVYERLVFEVWDGNTVKVLIESTLDKNKIPEISSSGNTLRIATRKNMKFGINLGTWNVKTYVTVSIPKSLASNSGLELDANTVSGSITMEELTARSIEADTTSGSIKVYDCFAKELDCESVSGSVTVDNGEYSDAEMKTTSGSIKLYATTTDRFKLESVSGSIKCETKAVPAKGGKANTVSGSVTLALPKNDGFTLDYSSMSGSVKNEFTGFSGKRSGKDTYKDGNPTFDVETMSGSIKVESL